MRLLLDTHVLLWAFGEPERLADDTLEQMADPRNDVLVSAASIWEATIKTARGRLPLPGNLPALIDGVGMDRLAVTFEHGMAAGLLPRHHADPFDRMLVAQAQVEGLTLVTADVALAAYGVPILAA